MEPAYRKENGHGFSTFACDVPKPMPPGGSFDCETVDEKGETARYAVTIHRRGGEHRMTAAKTPER